MSLVVGPPAAQSPQEEAHQVMDVLVLFEHLPQEGEQVLGLVLPAALKLGKNLVLPLTVAPGAIHAGYWGSWECVRWGIRGMYEGMYTVGILGERVLRV